MVETLQHDRPSLDRLIAKYQYPAPGSIKQYDFAYGRMASAVAYRESPTYAAVPSFEDDPPHEFDFGGVEDQPGVERVYRKVEAVRLTTDDLEALYLDWARHW